MREETGRRIANDPQGRPTARLRSVWNVVDFSHVL